MKDSFLFGCENHHQTRVGEFLFAATSERQGGAAPGSAMDFAEAAFFGQLHGEFRVNAGGGQQHRVAVGAEAWQVRVLQPRAACLRRRRRVRRRRRRLALLEIVERHIADASAADNAEGHPSR